MGFSRNDAKGRHAASCYESLPIKQAKLQTCKKDYGEGSKNFNLYSCSVGFLSQFFNRHRSEGLKTSAKREVGAILNRSHMHNYAEDQNRETSFIARPSKPQ